MALTYDELKSRALKLKSNIDYMKRSNDEDRVELNDTTNKIQSLEQQMSLQIASSTTLKHITDVMTLDKVNQMKDLLTSAVKFIFDDRDFEVDIDIKELRGSKSAEFLLQEKVVINGKEIIRKQPVKTSVGGGVMSVIGFISQVYDIKRKNLAPIFVMDEALTQISSEYIPNVMRFVNRIAEKDKFIFILISQDPRFLDYSNNSYQVINGKYTKLEDKRREHEDN